MSKSTNVSVRIIDAETGERLGAVSMEEGVFDQLYAPQQAERVRWVASTIREVARLKLPDANRRFVLVE